MFSKLLLYLLFYFNMTFAHNFSTPASKISVFNDIMNELINDCYKDLEHIFIVEHLDTGDSSATYPIVEKESVKYIRNTFPIKASSIPMSKIDAFFILTNTFRILDSTFKALNDMGVWKSNRPVFIFITEQIINFNVNINNFLWKKWSILNIYYIIMDHGNHMNVVTANPYSSYAPEHWGHPVNHRSINYFRRSYSKGNLCQGFVFDRTKYLDQLPLIFVSTTEYQEGFYFGKKQAWCTDHWQNALSIFDKALKTQNHLYCISTSANFENRLLFLEKNFKPVLYFPHVKYYLFEDSYPPSFREITIVTHNQGYQTLFQQIYNLFGKWIILYTCGLLIITFIVCFHLAKTDRVAFATFEVIRLLISASIRTDINGLVLKIFFLMIFLYFLIMQSLFQGKLAGFLTNPSTIKNADTLDDLESSAYRKVLWSSDSGIFYSNKKLFRKTERIININQLWNDFKNDTSLAVVDNMMMVGYLLKHYSDEVYVAKKPVIVEPYSHALRKGNPLNERINDVLLRYYELGFTELQNRETHQYYWETIDRLKLMSLTKGANKPINLKSIMPLIMFLTVGWISAIICFIGEIIVYRLQKSKQNNKKMKKNIDKIKELTP